MDLSLLSDDQKIQLYKHVTKKFPWAGKNNIKRLASQELRMGKIHFNESQDESNKIIGQQNKEE